MYRTAWQEREWLLHRYIQYYHIFICGSFGSYSAKNLSFGRTVSYMCVWVIERAVTPSLLSQIHSYIWSWREDLKEKVSFSWCFILLSVQY